MTIEDLDKINFRIGENFTDTEKYLISNLYNKFIGGKNFNSSCNNCFHDAYIELKIARKNNLFTMERKFELKKDTLIRFFGTEKMYSFSNTTDEDAIYLLQKNENHINSFEKYPENWRDYLVQKEVAPDVFTDMKGEPEIISEDKKKKVNEYLDRKKARKDSGSKI